MKFLRNWIIYQVILWALVGAVGGIVELVVYAYHNLSETGVTLVCLGLFIAILTIPLSLSVKNDMASGQGM